MVVDFYILGWRSIVQELFPHVAGPELSIVTASVKMNLTHVFLKLSAVGPANLVLDTGYQ